MIVVIVNIQVKTSYREQFEQLTKIKTTQANKEDGVVSFEFLFCDDTQEYVIIEKYTNIESRASHKKEIHYLEWNEKVEKMMSKARTHIIYNSIA